MFMIQHCILIIAYHHHKNMYWFTFKEEILQVGPEILPLPENRQGTSVPNNQPTNIWSEDLSEGFNTD